jgi:autotransporter strand-loop-strand O-heptosyltransferase
VQDKIKIYAHGSYVGTTGYNSHTRDFFRELNKHVRVKFRNFSVGKSWDQMSSTPHDGEKYLTDVDKSMLFEQTLWDQDGKLVDFPMYSSPEKEFVHNINIVLNETNHHYFFQKYKGPKIAFNVWESTEQPHEYFNKLKEFDELWVPSKWQKECSVKQGYPEEKIKVVPEGVDVDTFFPERVDPLDEYKDSRFKFLLFGRWDYRKSTKEIIETFIKTFSPEEPVDLVVSIDNMWGEKMDGYKTTEERLAAYNLLDPRVKIINFPSREDYIKFMKTGHVFVSCSRSEGWNLPLIEAMACGTPSIYSNCCAQLEFAEGKGFPVNIIGEKAANSNDYGSYTMSDLPGNYYEPDFSHLSQIMREVYENYDQCKEQSLRESEGIRRDFSWKKIGEIGYQAIVDFHNKIDYENYKSIIPDDKIKFSYLEGPKVTITGENNNSYRVEFLDGEGNSIYDDVISTNMWTTCSRKYYTEWKIKINGKIVDEFNLIDKRVLISFESKSIGDTVAWAPYAIEFAKKHSCKVILSTFHNNWFKGLESYKDVEFLEPGSHTLCYAVYRIGWFRDDEGGWKKFDFYPNQVNLIPLQQTATDILGLEFKEVNYGIDFPAGKKPVDGKYVVFGPNATAGCKEWDYNNWVSLSKMLREIGYSVITLTQKPFYIDGCKNVWGEPLSEVASYLHHADAFIGLGSGLSWLNWSLGKHTYMINGFSRDGHEFSERITKIYNDNTCIFCWNDEAFVFDSGDWDWCPVYKGTSKQHICQKSITPLQVFNKLKI